MGIYLNLTEKDYISIGRLERGNANDKRYAEILKLVITDDDFQKLVKSIRKELNIPPTGFNLDDKKQLALASKYIQPAQIIRDVFSPMGTSLGEIAENKIAIFLKNKNWYGAEKKYCNDDFHNINLTVPIKTYILGGFLGIKGCEMISVIIPDCSGTKEITLQMSPFITKQEVLDFVENNWGDINFIKENTTGKYFGKRNKIKKNYFRDIFIVSKFNEIKKKGVSYPEIKLATLLKERMNIHISDGTIRSIVSRINNLVADKET